QCSGTSRRCSGATVLWAGRVGESQAASEGGIGVWGGLRPVAVVVDYFSDDVLCAEPPSDAAVESLSLAGLFLIGSEVHQRLPERPTAPSCPCGGFDGHERLEALPALTTEECPSDRQVAGGIADSAAPKVQYA